MSNELIFSKTKLLQSLLIPLPQERYIQKCFKRLAIILSEKHIFSKRSFIAAPLPLLQKKTFLNLSEIERVNIFFLSQLCHPIIFSPRGNMTHGIFVGVIDLILRSAYCLQVIYTMFFLNECDYSEKALTFELNPKDN